MRSIFHEPIFARFVRIYPVTWEGAIGLRAGAIVCERACVGRELDYDFQLSLVYPCPKPETRNSKPATRNLEPET